MNVLECDECGYSRSNEDDGRWFDDVDGVLLCSECWYDDEAKVFN